MRSVAPTPHLRRAGVVLTFASLVAIGAATLLPEPGIARGSHFCLLCGSLGGVSSLLNVLLFIPLGIGLSLLGFRPVSAVTSAMALSLLIELTQLVALQGRYATLGDVITNTSGAALGFALSQSRYVLLRPQPRVARALAAYWSCIWLIVQLFASYGFSISLPDSDYYGQIARQVGNTTVFPGIVASALVGGVSIPNTILGDTRAVRHALLNGAPVVVEVITRTTAPGTAPIVRVADNRNREIVLIAEHGEDFIFGVRMGAQVLRLRPPVFALGNVFQDRYQDQGLSNDTLVLTAQYAFDRVALSSERASKTQGKVIRATPSLAWTLLLPSQWLIRGTRLEQVLSWFWVATLVAPLGFWLGAAVRHWQRTSVTSPLVVSGFAVLALLFVGVVVIPRIFGVAQGTVGDWIAACAGLGAGYLASSASRLAPSA